MAMEAALEEGAEYILDESERWNTLIPQVGDVLEVFLPGTDYLMPPPIWAGFLVVGSSVADLLTVSAEVKFLGCPDSTIAKDFSNRFNRRQSYIHLCGTRPCTVGVSTFALHVTHARWWTLGAFQADYFSPSARRQARKWLAAASGVEEPAEPTEKNPQGAVPKSSAKPPDSAHIFSPMMPPGLDKPRPRGDVSPAADAVDDLGDWENVGNPTAPLFMTPKDPRHAELQQRLRDVRAKLAPGTVPHTVDAEAEQPKVNKPLAAKPAFTDAPGRMAMTSGSLLQGSIGEPQRAPQQAADSSIPTSQSWKHPGSALISQALAVEKQRRRAERQKKKKKKKKKSKPGRFFDYLKKAVRKKKKKKSKDRQGIGPGGDPGGQGSSSSSSSSSSDGKDPRRKKKKRKVTTLADGTMVSCSRSSSSGSDSSEESESSDLEAPMRKRSRRNPGSILELLIAHVQEQLYQSATLDVDQKATALTSGVKIATFFSLNIRAHFPNANREQREMYSLARAMDALRAGQVPLAGDILAARFMALHQSLLDGSWVSAQHMELAPLEESTAASPSMVLATRRHTKLYQKVQGNDSRSGGYGRGRPREWSGWTDGRADGSYKGKGKGGKGFKGKWKDKGKGKSNTQANPWSTTLEKAEEKTPPKA